MKQNNFAYSSNAPASLQQGRSFDNTKFLLVYGFCHALVDFSCAFLVMGVIDIPGNFWLTIIFYNILAFCLQLPIGLFVDKYSQSKTAGIVGLFCVTSAFIFIRMPIFAVALAGFGNALFHIAGGRGALSIDSRKSVYVGLFVAPGGIGLALGMFLSIHQIVFSFLIIPISLLIMIIVLFFTKIPAISIKKKSEPMFSYAALVILLLAASIAIRSLIGLTIDFPWKANSFLLILLISAIALGKVLGGILADWFGWYKTGLFGLLLAAPLLAFGSTYPLWGLIGIFVFNFTVPITLIAISNVLPGQPGFSFGITTAALFIGSVPTYTHSIAWINYNWIVFCIIILATIFLYFGLGVYFNNTNADQTYQFHKSIN